MAEFGEQLKKAREEKGMTQQTLAEKVYVTRQTVSRWESGSRYPDLLTLRKLSSVLGMSADELLSNDYLPKVVEKTPVIEKPIVNNLIIALYAAAVLIFAIQSGTFLLSFSEMLTEIKSGGEQTYFLALAAIAEAVLLLFGFFILLGGADTPRKSGFILFGYFALEALSRISNLLSAVYENSLLQAGMIILAAVPFILGAAGVFLHFFSYGHGKAPKYLIYFASAYGMITVLGSLVNNCVHNNSIVHISHIFSVLFRVILYAVFCYQAYVLSIRRKLAKDIVNQ